MRPLFSEQRIGRSVPTRSTRCRFRSAPRATRAATSPGRAPQLSGRPGRAPQTAVLT